DYTKARQLDQAEAVQQEAASAGGSFSSADSSTAPSLNVDHQHLGGIRGVPGCLKMPDCAQSTREGLIFTNPAALVRTKDRDIHSYAPFLNERNMFVFFGRGGTFREVGLAKRPPQAPAAVK